MSLLYRRTHIHSEERGVYVRADGKKGGSFMNEYVWPVHSLVCAGKGGGVCVCLGVVGGLQYSSLSNSKFTSLHCLVVELF